MWLESLQHPEEIGGLADLMRLAKVETVVEVGAGPCGTAIYFSEVVGPTGRVISIDLPPEIGGTPKQYEDMARAKAENWVMVRGDSGANQTRDRVLAALGERPIGLLFIDGEHTRAAALRDMEVYRPYLHENGIIAFHDILLPELWTMWCGLRGKRGPALSMEFVDDRRSIGFGIGALIGREDRFGE